MQILSKVYIQLIYILKWTNLPLQVALWLDLILLAHRWKSSLGPQAPEKHGYSELFFEAVWLHLVARGLGLRHTDKVVRVLKNSVGGFSSGAPRPTWLCWRLALTRKVGSGGGGAGGRGLVEREVWILKTLQVGGVGLGRGLLLASWCFFSVCNIIRLEAGVAVRLLSISAIGGSIHHARMPVLTCLGFSFSSGFCPTLEIFLLTSGAEGWGGACRGKIVSLLYLTFDHHEHSAFKTS